jgi:DNA-binding transcriptional regulator YbjK
MRRPSRKKLKLPNEAVSKARGGESRGAIVGAAQRLFLERGFGAVSGYAC